MSESGILGASVIFGRPGSGKSSLAERLRDEFGFTLIRTGELLREAVRAGTPLGNRAEVALKGGRLVPDPLVAELLEKALASPGSDRILFDGFPRTSGQIPILERLEDEKGFRIDRYLEIAVGRDAATARMTGRRVCPACGTTYHIANRPPKVTGICDRDGATLESRPDDAPEVVEARQRTFDEQTSPVLDHYRTRAPERYRLIDGEQPFADAYAQTRRALGLEPRGTPPA